MRTHRALFGGILLFGLASTAMGAGLNLPAGAVLRSGGGTIDLAGGGVLIGGSLDLGAGQVLDASPFAVLAGGSAQLGSGLVRVVGDWSNLGSVVAGSSQVQFRDGTGASSLLGTTTFANLSLVSASSKTYALQSGATQTVSGALDIYGTPALPIQIASTTPGSTAFLDLLPGGTQSIGDVGVSDVHATGQHLAPDQTNRGGSGNDTGWFGIAAATIVEVPSLTPAGLAILLLALGIAALGPRRNSTWRLRHD